MPRRSVLRTAARVLVPLVAVAALALAAWAWTPDLDRATLESRYLAAPADRREVAGTTLHVRDEGPRDAPAVLMLHGFASSLHTWDAWAAALADRHRVVRIDLPGHALSGPDATGDYSDGRSREVLLALLDALGIARATVVGHSIGGRIAWSFAARHPERVERLVLLAPDGFASPGFEYGRATPMPALASAMRWVLPRTVLRSSLEAAYVDPAQATEARVDRYHDLMRAPGVRGAMLERMRQTVLEDPVPRLRAIAVPTLLIWGERDAMIPVANADDYLAALPRATLLRLPGVGHVPQEEGGTRPIEALRAFLDAPGPDAPSPDATAR